MGRPKGARSKVSRELRVVMDKLEREEVIHPRQWLSRLEAIAMSDESAAAARLQQILDRYVLARVHINPESRVKVEQGDARPELVQGGSRLFLVKVINEGGVRAPLAVQSPNSERVYVPAWVSGGAPEPKHQLAAADVRDRWADISLYTAAPMRARLSGLAVEYAILQVYSRDAGQRSATVA